MNKIEGKLWKAEHEGAQPYLDYFIDNYWLAKNLDEKYPDRGYNCLVPTLSYWLYNEGEKQVVWNRILPDLDITTLCPVLMCEDDCDFSCTLLVAEIINKGNVICWNRFGSNSEGGDVPEEVATKVDWFPDFEPLEFSIDDYLNMLNNFKYHYELGKIEQEKKLKEKGV